MFQLVNWRCLALGLSACVSASTCSAAENEAGVAQGWPVVLRGAIIGTPVAADLDGDGKLEVVASAMRSANDRDLRSPDPTIAAQLWAFKSDGKDFPGWPLTIKSVEERQAMYDDKAFKANADNWYTTPSVWDVDGDGSDELVLNTPGYGATDERGNIVVIYADGGRLPIAHGGSDWVIAPIADIDGDGVPDMVLNNVLTNVLGKPVQNWPFEKRLKTGSQPAIGDADNDGQPEIAMPSGEEGIKVFNNHGELLPGWPRKVSPYSSYVVMGDVTGDDKKEIITVDFSQNLRVWNWDGTPVQFAPDVKAPSAQFLSRAEKRMYPGDADDIVMATGMGGFAPPCLADLDGDGKAEILMIGNNSRAVYAFRGDGRPFLDKPRGADEPWPKLSVPTADGKDYRLLDPEVPDDRKRLEDYDARQRRGRIAELPFLNARAQSGVTAVDLGGDGVMDIFAGTQWIRLAKDGSTQITEMVPPEPVPKEDPIIAKLRAQWIKEGKKVAPRQIKTPEVINDGSCSVVDIDGDGLAEVLFGLSDGRLFVYRTGMSLKARDAQWPTLSGNFQHTGVWTRAE